MMLCTLAATVLLSSSSCVRRLQSQAGWCSAAQAKRASEAASKRSGNVSSSDEAAGALEKPLSSEWLKDPMGAFFSDVL